MKARHEADGGAAVAPAEAAPAADPHLLERVLQFRPVRLLPGAHHPGPEVPDWRHGGADHLGLLLPAVLRVGRQLFGRNPQENVSGTPRSLLFFLCSGISSGRSKRFVFAHVLTKNPRS